MNVFSQQFKRKYVDNKSFFFSRAKSEQHTNNKVDCKENLQQIKQSNTHTHTFTHNHSNHYKSRIQNMSFPISFDTHWKRLLLLAVMQSSVRFPEHVPFNIMGFWCFGRNITHTRIYRNMVSVTHQENSYMKSTWAVCDLRQRTGRNMPFNRLKALPADALQPLGENRKPRKTPLEMGADWTNRLIFIGRLKALAIVECNRN